MHLDLRDLAVNLIGAWRSIPKMACVYDYEAQTVSRMSRFTYTIRIILNPAYAQPLTLGLAPPGTSHTSVIDIDHPAHTDSLSHTHLLTKLAPLSPAPFSFSPKSFAILSTLARWIACRAKRACRG